MSSRHLARPTFTPSSPNPHLVAGPSFDATLLQEVSRVQHDKTLQAVRDLIDRIGITETRSGSYSVEERTARAFRTDLLAGIRRLRDEATS